MFKYEKRAIVLVLFLILSGQCLAQKGILVDQDIRIAKYEFDFLNYLKNEKEFSDMSKEFNLENYKDRIIIKKQLEIYKGDSNTSFLLVKFKATSDHGNIYWGILTDSKVYFFHNIHSGQFLTFQKYTNPKIMTLIKYYIKEFD